MKPAIQWLSFVVVILFPMYLSAQHCPFDGLYTIAIRVNHAGKKGDIPVFYLLEKESFRTDTCRFTHRVDSIPFNTEKQVRMDMKADPRSTRSRYLPQSLKKDHNFLHGNRVVFLNMSAVDCMVARGNEYAYIRRSFVIRYTYGQKEKEVAVPAESIFALCHANGRWKRIVPLEIRL